MQLKLVLLMTSLFLNSASAKNLGIYGQVFKVAEESFLEVIQNRLKVMNEQGKMEKIQQDLQERAAAKVKRPTPVEEMTKARSYFRKHFDPTFVVSQNIQDKKGNLIALAGTSYNPLDHKSIGDPLIFIDGDDEDQIQWAISQKAKIILVNGSPLELEKAYKRSFYFDQGGVLTQKLDITEVPSLVSQEDKHLLIETIPVPTVDLKSVPLLGEGHEK